jgi:hypothetical protein
MGLGGLLLFMSFGAIADAAVDGHGAPGTAGQKCFNYDGRSDDSWNC